jgi:hypothetical protein
MGLISIFPFIYCTKHCPLFVLTFEADMRGKIIYIKGDNEKNKKR